MLAGVVTVAGGVGVGLGVAGLVLRRSDPRAQLLVVAASGVFLLVVPPVVGIVLFAVVHTWIGVAAGAAVVVAYAAVYGPTYRAQPVPGDAVMVRVMTQNLLLGRADAVELVDTVARHDPDVVFLQELTPAAERYLGDAGLDRLLPHRWTQPDRSAFGAGIWSRFPLSAHRTYPDLVTATLSATATLPGGGELELVGVHPPAPWPRPPGPWRSDLATLGEILRAAGPGPSVVGGDFNATVDHTPFRRLLRGGFRDAAGQAGAGLVRTWPADRSFPPVIGIDHVLTRGAVATHVRTIRVRGTDHLGLVVTVVVPR